MLYILYYFVVDLVGLIYECIFFSLVFYTPTKLYRCGQSI